MCIHVVVWKTFLTPYYTVCQFAFCHLDLAVNVCSEVVCTSDTSTTNTIATPIHSIIFIFFTTYLLLLHVLTTKPCVMINFWFQQLWIFKRQFIQDPIFVYVSVLLFCLSVKATNCEISFFYAKINRFGQFFFHLIDIINWFVVWFKKNQ